MIQDQRSDKNGQILYGLLATVDESGVKIFDPPEFVKTASSARIVGDDDMAPSVYGNPVDRKFPCHNGASTWVSAVFFHSQKPEMPVKQAASIEQRLTAAATFHGVADAVQAVKIAAEKARDTALENLSEDNFALVVQTGDQRDLHLPIRNSNEIKAACEYLQKWQGEFSFDDRRTVASRILKKAAVLKSDLGEDDTKFLEKAAGRGACSLETLSRTLFERAKILKTANLSLDAAQHLVEMALECESAPTVSLVPSNLCKLASVVDKVDREYSLTRFKVPPVSDLFQLSPQVMQEALDTHFETKTGNCYKIADLDKVPTQALQAVFGEKFLQDVTDGLHVNLTKLASAASEMPVSDAAILDRLLKKASVGPVYREPAAESRGLLADPAALVGMASLA